MNTAEKPMELEKGQGALPERLRLDVEPAPTRGEKATHWFAHSFINFWINYILSLSITDLFLGHTDRGDGKLTSFFAEKAGDNAFGRRLKRFSDWLRDGYDFGHKALFQGMRKVSGNDAVNKTVADTGMDIFTLMMGGHFTASAATYIMNRSDKWARRFDDWFDRRKGHTPTEEEKAAREARYEYLRQQPKKGAWTIIKSRILGFALNTFVLGWLTSKMDPRTYNAEKKAELEANKRKTGIRTFTEMFGDWLGDKAARSGRMSQANVARTRYWGELIPFEGLCTLNQSLTLEWMMKAGKKKSRPVKPVVDAKPEPQAAGSPRSDEETPAAANKETRWTGMRIPVREEIKPREERQEQAALASL